MALINPVVNEKLNMIHGKCFAMNRFLDRGMSLLSVKWKMKRTASILHPAIAHAFPSDKFSDAIAEYQASRDTLTIYPSTPIGDEDYDSPAEFIARFYNEMIELQDMLYDAYDLAVEDGDHATRVFLDGIIKNCVEYTDVAKTLVDLFEMYGSDNRGLIMLDAVIDNYIKI